MDSANQTTSPEASITEPSQTPLLTAQNTVSPNMQGKVKRATTLGKELNEDMEKWFSGTAKLREEKKEQDKKIDSFVKRRDAFDALRCSESAKIVPGKFSPYMENVDFRVGEALKIECEAILQEHHRIKKKEEENAFLRQTCNNKKAIFDELMDEITKMAIEFEQTNQDMQSLLAACPWKSHAEESIHAGGRDDVGFFVYWKVNYVLIFDYFQDSPSASDQSSNSRSG
ncbi:hypothetical protein CAEBREN_18163 [Caenorhabditis brenneri]|uniref:Uncharacterized protein n=1 Tax=Caenorhabditis brenneri TaxID=135651 RepID=G0MBE2_CAEBE|nr:hypothetical protein CAEBREN_18163 [Caenorhabditis brenneri]